MGPGRAPGSGPGLWTVSGNWYSVLVRYSVRVSIFLTRRLLQWSCIQLNQGLVLPIITHCIITLVYSRFQCRVLGPLLYIQIGYPLGNFPHSTDVCVLLCFVVLVAACSSLFAHWLGEYASLCGLSQNGYGTDPSCYMLSVWTLLLLLSSRTNL